jgi:glutathione S-transferase
MTDRVRVIGSYLSPYVRKVLVALDVKGIAYEIDPIVPFMGDDRFGALSPLRRIPVLIDGDVVLCDSTVIGEYLDDRYPTPALRPEDVADRARARWLEEYADTRMGDVFIWRIFNERVIKPAIWRQPTDEAVLQRALADEWPDVLDYLESHLPEQGFVCGTLSMADIAVATFFRNAGFAGCHVDAERWPRTAGFVERVLDLEAFRTLAPFEALTLRTPPAVLRAALAEAGAPIAADTCSTDTPRRGAMTV